MQELGINEDVSPLEPIFARARDISEMPPMTVHGFAIAYQVGCGRNILDFHVNAMGRRLIRADVETDGYSYHGEEEQFGRDRQRDIFVQECGLKVLRFTGAQIRSDHDKYAQQALQVIWRMAVG